MPRPPRDIDVQRKALGLNWLDPRDAARELGTDVKTLRESIGPLLTRESRSLAGRGARFVGYAYARADIERCKAFMTGLGCGPLHAARLLHDIRRLGELGVLPEDLLALELKRQTMSKRRFQ